MDIPEYLKMENRRPLKSEELEMMKAINRYAEVIGSDLITEPSSYTTQEWIEMLNECINKKITIWELWGGGI